MLAKFNEAHCQDMAKGYINDYAGSNAVLFRGVTPLKYVFLFGGIYYAYSEDFEEGELYYHGKYYSGVKLNLDAHRDHLLAQVPGSFINVVLDSEWVEWFTYGKKRFIHVSQDDYNGVLASGFYEVLYDGEGTLLKKNEKKLDENVDKNLREGSYARKFYSANRYYLVKDGEITYISGVKSFAGMYKEQKKGIRQFIKKQHRSFTRKENIDESLVKVMSFIEKKQ